MVKLPIVDHVLRHGGGRGIQALIVYPMNALANSQYQELEKFLLLGYPDGKGPVTGPVVPAASTLLTGTVEPRSHGTVTVSRQVAGGWRVVAYPDVDPKGEFRTPLRLRPDVYRVTVAADDRFAAATATVRITRGLLASLQQ